MWRVAVVLLAASVVTTQGLRCFVCDSESNGDQCESEPEGIPNGSMECNEPNDDFCYTLTLEEDSGKKTSVKRGCCRVREAHEACPPGNATQTEVGPGDPAEWKKTRNRCTLDLCNSADTTGGGEGGGVLVVDGKSGADGLLPAAVAIVVVSVANVAKTLLL